MSSATAAKPVPRQAAARRRRAFSFFKAGHLFVLPYLFFMLVFGLGPALYAVVVSVSKFQFGRPLLFQAGLDNFATAFTHYRFLPAFQNVLGYLALSLPVALLGVIGLSLLLHARPSRLADGVRTVYFLPGAVTGPALVLVAIFMFDPNVSPFRPLLTAMGMEALINVIRPQRLVLLFTLITFFAGAGGWIAIFYGALNGISKEVVEAATIDGCGAWELASRIKLPLILPYVWYMLILSFAGNVQLFAEPQLIGAALPGVIGPSWSPNLLSYDFAFTLGNFGAAAAVSLVLLAIGLIAAYLVITFTGFYQTDAAD